MRNLKFIFVLGLSCGFVSCGLKSFETSKTKATTYNGGIRLKIAATPLSATDVTISPVILTNTLFDNVVICANTNAADCNAQDGKTKAYQQADLQEGLTVVNGTQSIWTYTLDNTINLNKFNPGGKVTFTFVGTKGGITDARAVELTPLPVQK